MSSEASFWTSPVLAVLINIAGMIIIPLLLFWITNKAQAKEQRRKDKMQIFTVLMTNRELGWSIDTVHALNMLDIVFSNDKKVRMAWCAYYKALCNQSGDSACIDTQRKAYKALLKEMAASLGYQENILWEAVDKPYIPQGMMDAFQQQQHFQSGKVQLMDMLLQNAPEMIHGSSQSKSGALDKGDSLSM